MSNKIAGIYVYNNHETNMPAYVGKANDINHLEFGGRDTQHGRLNLTTNLWDNEYSNNRCKYSLTRVFELYPEDIGLKKDNKEDFETALFLLEAISIKYFGTYNPLDGTNCYGFNRTKGNHYDYIDDFQSKECDFEAIFNRRPNTDNFNKLLKAYQNEIKNIITCLKYIFTTNDTKIKAERTKIKETRMHAYKEWVALQVFKFAKLNINEYRYNLVFDGGTDRLLRDLDENPLNYNIIVTDNWDTYGKYTKNSTYIYCNFSKYLNDDLSFNSQKFIKDILKKVNEMIGNNDFNIVISNPPYGKIGAEITKLIKENINYKEFINLLPASHYIRTEDGLWNYADLDSIEVIKDGFTDASVTTHIAKINKFKNNKSFAEGNISFVLSNPNKEIYNALKSYLLKVFDNNLDFYLSYTDYEVKPLDFIFNGGGYEISGNGKLSIFAKGKYTDAVNWNVFNIAPSDGKHRFPVNHFNTQSMFNGFKTYIYNEDTLKFLQLLFSSLPAGYGFKKIFADIDYTKYNSLNDVLNILGLTEAECLTIFNAIKDIKLSEQEIKLCKEVQNETK